MIFPLAPLVGIPIAHVFANTILFDAYVLPLEAVGVCLPVSYYLLELMYAGMENMLDLT
jgi:hypothetical protein